MPIQRWLTSGCVLALTSLCLLGPCAAAQDNKKDDEYSCSEPNPEAQCSASNTCGSADTPCVVDVKRTGSSASATPDVKKPSGNIFCIYNGTTVTWKSTSKNTGFLVDFGPTSPFDPPDTITGGSKKPASVKTVKPGCFAYSFQATKATAVHGLSKASRGKLIVLAGK